MLTEVKNNYKSILKHFDFDESISSSDHKRQKLIEMAKNGKQRPRGKTKLGNALIKCTCKSSKSYCKKFDKLIRELAPDWFISRTQIANKKKQELIRMAKNKDHRPRKKTKLGMSLCDYTIPCRSSYCPKFDKIIRKLAPNWFLGQTQIADQKKQQLIELAKSGAKRPNQKTKEGRALSTYTRESSGCYCCEFDKFIRKEAPSWFVSQEERANQVKQKLIEIAKNKKPRPSQKTKLGRALCNYTSKSNDCYCLKFDKSIRRLAKHWFIPRTQIANQKKQKLILMAKNGENRPTRQSKLGIALSNHLRKCPKFDKIIRKLAPNWFLGQTQIADQKKQQLIELAKSGAKRPNQKTTKLGVSLSNYTGKFTYSYCPKFDKTIRKLRPDWFRK
jgi:hypothetical protein